MNGDTASKLAFATDSIRNGSRYLTEQAASVCEQMNAAWPVMRDAHERIRDLESELANLRHTVDGYRYAAAWASGDSWDGCPECKARFVWARSRDKDYDLDDKKMAAMSSSFLHSQ